MLHKLASHNDDIKCLVERGFAVAFDSNCMVIRDIPYLDSQRQLQTGAIVTKLVFENQERVRQEDHQIFFAGSHPHQTNGTPIPNIGIRDASYPLSEACRDVVVRFALSNKPKNEDGALRGYVDFFEKIKNYVAIICGPAKELHDTPLPYTFSIVEGGVIDSVFKFHDTLTSRAEITELSRKFKDDIVAIIGLGGTGAYLLDFLIKTPVREIRAFDLDSFYVHNTFRSPGRVDNSEFCRSKADIYRARYDNFRTGLTFIPKYFDASCTEDIEGVTFAFVCVDKGASRAEIFDLLISKNIPFIDVGMGLNRKRFLLNGQLRTTYYSAENGQSMRDKGLAPLADDPNDEYKINIQISELNALNACLAAIRFKQLRGFYYESTPYDHLIWSLGDFNLFRQPDGNEED